MLHAITRHRSCPENLGDFRMIILNQQLSVDGKPEGRYQSQDERRQGCWWACDTQTDSVRLGASDNAPDFVDLGAIVLGDLANRHPYFTHERMRENCDRGILGRLRLGRYGSCNFHIAFRWSGDYLQHPWLAAGWRRCRAFGNGWFDSWWLRREERVGCLARSDDLLAIVVARVLLSVKQKLAPVG